MGNYFSKKRENKEIPNYPTWRCHSLLTFTSQNSLTGNVHCPQRTDESKRNSWISQTNNFGPKSNLGYLIPTQEAEWLQFEHQGQDGFNSTQIRTCQKINLMKQFVLTIYTVICLAIRHHLISIGKPVKHLQFAQHKLVEYAL